MTTESHRKTALVTGASSGMGRQFAILLAEQGCDLILVARSEQKLEELREEIGSTYKCSTYIFLTDLSRPDAPAKLCEELKKKGLLVDILINNAGFGTYSPFTDMHDNLRKDMLAVNASSPVELIHLLLPGMLTRGYGRILNVSSTAAFYSMPLFAVYAASKAFLLSFSEALAGELWHSGVTVTALCPGPVGTSFTDGTNMLQARLYRWLPMADSRKIATKGLRALFRGKLSITPGIVNKLLIFSARFAPRFVNLLFVRFLMKS